MNPTSILRVFGKSTLGRRFTAITLMFLTVLLGIMVYTTTTIQKEKSNAILIDMAGRQRMLFERHLNEVYLTSQGITADYKSTRELLRSTLASLMKGGSVTLDPETGESQTIPAAPTEKILLKLHEQENYFEKVIESSNGLLMLSPDLPEFYRVLKTLRAQNSIVIGTADDAVKQLARHSESNIATMMKWESIAAFFVALLGVFVTTQGVRASKKLENEIAERKRAESALWDSELFLNSIVENIPDMIFVKDAKKLQFLRLNKAGEELVGHPQEAMIGKTDYDFFPKSEADFYTTKDRETLRGKTLIDIPEEVIQTKSHGTRYLHTKKIPILDEHGIPLYLLGISEDITERKTSEQQAKRLSRQNELILSSAGNGIYGLNLQGQATFVNPAGAKMLGYTPRELIGRSMHTTIHRTKTDGSPYPQNECPMYAAFTDGTIHKVEDEVLCRKDGTSFPVEYTSTPIWEDGDLVGAVVTFQDVSERKQAEAILRTTVQMYRQILDSISDMVFMKDQNFRMLWANKAFRTYYNMTNEEIEGILDAPFNEPEYTKAYNKDDAYVLNKGEILDIPEEPVTRYDGQVRLFHTIKAPLFGEKGEVEKLVGVARDITERKQAELKRAQQELLLRLIFETGPGCIKRVAADGTLLHMNPAGLSLIEAEEENEALGLSVFDLVVSEHLDAFKDMHQKVIEGEPQTLQFEVQGLKGGRRWMETYAVPFSNPLTKEVEQLAVTHDITERKNSEKALEALAKGAATLGNQNFFENLVRQLAHTLQVPMVFIAERVEELFPIVPGVAFWNGDHFEEKFEYNCVEGPCEKVFDGHPVYFPKGVQESFPNNPTVKALNLESYCGTALFNSEGAIVGNLAIMDQKPLSLNTQDQSLLKIFAARAGGELERKRAQEALQESQERYRTLYEDNPSMYFTVAQDGKIISVNQFGAEQLGYSVEELIGQPVIGIFLADDKPLVQKHFNACLQNPMKLFSWELRKQKKDGNILWVRETARTIKSKDEEAVVLIVCEDITERKHTEERLRQSEAKETEALRKSDELKSALLSSVSHELRTPLTAMKGSISSIIGRAPSNMDQEQQAFLKGIDREIDYMSQLVNNLLDMSQIEAGTLIPHKEWHLLEDLVEGSLRRAEQTLDTRDIDIHIPENVPPVFVDPVQIQQVFINLLDNAVKYSLPASPIRLNVRVEAQNIAVEVSNEGATIQPRDLERIFDRFYRRPPPRQQPIHGTGLGLAICKGIVEAHGGRIWAESIEKKVTITLTIPTTEHMASFSLEGRHKSQRGL